MEWDHVVRFVTRLARLRGGDLRETAVDLAEAEHRDLMFVGDEHSLAIELKCVAEALGPSLAEGHELNLKADSRLEENRHRATRDDVCLDIRSLNRTYLRLRLLWHLEPGPL